ncbi:tRNA pseudouridine(38-40) synthase TruA [Cytophagales bacterium LB-30]|uniref:tRNA pseudouridine synthase A n=1 Tax=Shiella aurantiaca TaxID=3058365 RepID=A0ABT8F682_9BACT|nr:tRNA pseudouridine(38-40) synthase TruA [Shiella aurantiaca]MDN4165972.1 tRNA pseudouridine(38-40) synthase TruA [Shiella aurantiaca]
MPRLFVDMAYKGSAYHGWQRQLNALSVQEVVEEALAKILPQATEIVGSGRTDTGVHASQQIFHVDVPEGLNPDKLQYQLNALLPFDLAIKSCRWVTPEAHARFDAVQRGYHYHIIRQKDPFRHGMAYHYITPLDVEKMNEAAELMCTKTDFECFSKVKTEVNTFLCTLFKAQWTEDNGNLVFYVSANRFLRGMVRAMVGTLLEVGRGKLSLADFEAILDGKNRQEAGRAVPAEGLFLSEVRYPESIYLS